MNDTAKNPVILILHFRGWELRQYKGGQWDATKGIAVTPGFQIFADLMEYLLNPTLGNQIKLGGK